MIRWLLQFILLSVLIWIIWRFLGGIIDGLRPEDERAAHGKGKAASVPLVRDPVCGTYVVRANAITAASGSQTHYFCSEKCRDEFRRRS
jgi:YHS domain-containing protein